MQGAFPNGFLAALGGLGLLCALAAATLALFPDPWLVDPWPHAITVPGLLLAAAPLAAALLSTFATITLARQPSKQTRLPGWCVRGAPARILAWVSVAFGITAILLPSYRFGEGAAYYLRLRPLLAWVGTVGAECLALQFYARKDRLATEWRGWRQSMSRLIRAAGYVLLALLAAGIAMLASIRGLRTYEDFQYEPGVPVLAGQVVAAVLVALVFDRIIEKRRLGNRPGLDVMVFTGIWLAVGIYWASMPSPASYMNPEPLPPNHEIYPYSDSAQYDLQAHSALMGYGLGGGKAIGSPLYPALLTLEHLLGGNGFATTMRLQAGIFAVLSALAYVLGRRLHGRVLGMLFAVMVALRGANAIAAAGTINTGSPGQMLTDFPTAIGAALVALVAVELQQRREARPSMAVWLGAAAALAFLIRPTAMVLLAVAPIIALLRRPPFGLWLRTSALALAGAAVLLAPWAVRNGISAQSPLKPYLEKIDLVRETRYGPAAQSGATPVVATAPAAEPSTTHEAARPADSETSAPARVPTAEAELTPGATDRRGGTRSAVVDLAAIAPIFGFHVSNNLIGSALILPTSPVLHDLMHVLRAPESLWMPHWGGLLTSGQVVGLLVCAGVLALGAAALWRRAGTAACAPLIVFLLYQLANSGGRTSGGRYIVPVDWIVLLYFAAGLLALLRPADTNPLRTPGGRRTRRDGLRVAVIPALASAVLLGFFPVVVDVAPQLLVRNAPESAVQLDSAARDVLLDASYRARDVERYLTDDDGLRLHGRAFYPRWFSYRAVQRAAEGGLPRLAFPRLQFTVIDPQRGPVDVYLFITREVPLANGSDVTVIGCKISADRYVAALAIVDESSGGGVVFRDGLRSLKCPQPTPACDNNGSCQ